MYNPLNNDLYSKIIFFYKFIYFCSSYKFKTSEVVNPNKKLQLFF